MKKINYSVKGKASDYLEINPLPKQLEQYLVGLDYVIYGGYVRDLIAKKHNPSFNDGFKDIDILLLPRSFRKLLNNLKNNGYELSNDEQAQKVYKHWGAVSHIYDMVPDNDGLRIQLVAPNPPQKFPLSPLQLRDEMLEPVMAADIRCCAVALTNNGKLIEVLPGAYDDCKSLTLKESKLAAHKVNLKERIIKLKKRGWIVK